MRPVTTALADRACGAVTTSLFDQIGGHAQIARLVESFQRRLFEDEDLARQLEPLGRGALEQGLIAFLARALGGPIAEVADGSRPQVDPLSVWLDIEPFTRVVAHLWVTLLELDVSPNLKDEVVVAVVLNALGPPSSAPPAQPRW
jgi:truncated hemoglobin YjbI